MPQENNQYSHIFFSLDFTSSFSTSNSIMSTEGLTSVNNFNSNNSSSSNNNNNSLVKVASPASAETGFCQPSSSPNSSSSTYQAPLTAATSASSASAANAAILNPTTGIPEIPAGSPKSGSGPDSDEGMF